MTRPVDRFFPQFERGRIREDLLRAFRESLRGRIDPDTQLVIDERVIAIVTAAGGRFHTEADALDLDGMAIQQRAITMLGNLRPVGSTTSWLYAYHGPLRGESPLPATGGAGRVEARANPGVIWTGSTTAADPFAVRGTDAAGNRYQVVISATTDVNGKATLLIKGLDTGEVTNLPEHDPPDVISQITWANPPVGAQITANVIEEFVGGLEAETAEDFAQRLEDQDRYKQAAGNNAQNRALARSVSNAVDDAFVYACALHSGSTVLSFLVKRPKSGTLGPLATIPDTDQILAVRDRVVPPGSSDVPERAYFLVLPPVANPTDMVLKLSQRKGTGEGWTDALPWPFAGTTAAYISSIADQENFVVTTDGGTLPTGVTAPSLMAWDAANSRWGLLNVASVTDNLDGTYDVALNAPAPYTIGGNHFISPAMSQVRADVLAESVELYFDTLGPGQIVPELDTRRSRAARFPEPPERPYAIGQEIVLFVGEALTTTGAVLVSPDPGDPAVSEPDIPTHPSLGPGKLTLNRLAVYPLS